MIDYVVPTRPEMLLPVEQHVRGNSMLDKGVIVKRDRRHAFRMHDPQEPKEPGRRAVLQRSAFPIGQNLVNRRRDTSEPIPIQEILVRPEVGLILGKSRKPRLEVAAAEGGARSWQPAVINSCQNQIAKLISERHCVAHRP
jgi:hypothetical protein